LGVRQSQRISLDAGQRAACVSRNFVGRRNWVALCFLFPAAGLGALDGLRGDGAALTTGGYVLAFLFYLTQYFVIFFFNSALVGAV
jgi:hypothetical protein